MGGLVWFDKTIQACQGPTSFIAYERGWVIFEYSHVFGNGGSLISCEYKEGLSDETKNRGPLYLSVYATARASKRSHTGGQ
jgi:hypothetical protein